MSDAIATMAGKPDIGELTEELGRSSRDFGQTSQVNRAEDIRYCRWPGQSDDGRKWTANLANKTAFPWDGCADGRVYLADDIINSLVDTDTTSFWRALLKVNAVEVGDLDKSTTANALMDWIVNTRLYTELTREVELLSQYVHTYGWAGVHITWQQEDGLKEMTITMDQMLQFASQAPEGSPVAELAEMIQNPEADDQVSELLMGVMPSLKKGRAMRVVKDLREKGTASFPVPVQTKNQPCIAALSPWDELSFPPETTDLQSARCVFRRMYMTEAQLKAKAEVEGWNESWVEEALQTAGRWSTYSELGSTGPNQEGLTVLGRENLIEVVYGYTRSVNEDNVPGVYCTVFSPFVGTKWADHYLLDYGHGEYPFVVWRSEILHRKIVESRGVPQIVDTWQTEIKVQRDSILDYTSLSTIPPLQVPKGRAGNLKLGPAVQVPVLRPGEISWMAPPQRDPVTAFSLITAIEVQADRYFGRPTEKVSPTLTSMRQQRGVTSWLHGWTVAFRQVLALSLQYYSPEEISKITGSQVQIGEGDAGYDISLKFDVRELSSDMVTEKLKAISQLVLPLDTAGVVDRSKLVKLIMRAIDPSFASELVMDAGPAAQKMFDETNGEIALMSLGNPPKLRENDPSAGTRLQFAQNIVQSNPKYQQQIPMDPVFQENFQKYMENLQFSVTQQQNAVVGRLGVQQ
jgi:hypothetical protein